MGKRKNNVFTDEILGGEYEAVYRYILSLCRDEAQAQDITQETFLKAMKASESFKGASSLYTWLCAIGKRIWLNRCKQQGREISCDFTEKAFTDEEKSVHQIITEKEVVLHIHRILHTMSEPYKEVFSLRVFGELSFSDIAALFSKTESWARVTFYRARKMINEELRKDGYYE